MWSRFLAVRLSILKPSSSFLRVIQSIYCKLTAFILFLAHLRFVDGMDRPRTP
eukprot:m.51753 g.51753  ORF g.51753 m.51753 type:complete len:53 (+) comp34158_c0_seq27:72-230(+)